MNGHRIIEVQPPQGGPLCIVVDRRLEVGRECDGLLVDDALLSRRHLAVWESHDQVLLEDLGSRNGTAVDGVALSGPTSLQSGSTATAGETTIRLADLRATVPSPMGGARTAHRETVAPGDISDSSHSVTGQATADAQSSGRDARATMIEAIAHDVVNAGQPLAGAVPRSGDTVTFLFSDIESSTQMAESLGDNSWFNCLSEHNQLVERLVAEHDGRVVKAIGDGYMITFGSARSAIRCAIAIQHQLLETDAGSGSSPVRVRMGLHTGEAVEAGGDLFGLHVNVAARVANLASGGQILVSDLTRAITQVSGDLDFGSESQVPLKGLSGTYGVSELRWQSSADERHAGPDQPLPSSSENSGDGSSGGDARATTVVRPS